MLTKSKIQLIKEQLEVSNDYREGLENLMDKYMIEDSTFVYKNGMVYEATSGYFVEKSAYTSLQDAVRACNINTCGIRIIENKEFIVGELKKTLSECSNDQKIFDITKLVDVR